MADENGLPPSPEMDYLDGNQGTEGAENEYNSIDKELDQLNSCLDALENWNDSLHSRMKEFLENIKEKNAQEKPTVQENQKMEVDDK